MVRFVALLGPGLVPLSFRRLGSVRLRPGGWRRATALFPEGGLQHLYSGTEALVLGQVSGPLLLGEDDLARRTEPRHAERSRASRKNSRRSRGSGGHRALVRPVREGSLLWDFIAPEIKAALFVVDRSGGHQVPEQVLSGNPGQTVVCDGGTCFNPLKGKKRLQRDWVHIRRHAKEGLLGYETISDAPDWRWLKSVKSAAEAVLKTAKLPRGKERDRKVAEVRRRVDRLLVREVDGEPARKLRKYLVDRGEELWTWVGTGGLAQSNAAEQGLRFHIAGKRKVSGGSRALVGAVRTAALASVHATARMRSIPFAEVGDRLVRGAADPFLPGAGPPSSPGPVTSAATGSWAGALSPPSRHDL